jgi:tetratricopeptide (TPR) repeat protein
LVGFIGGMLGLTALGSALQRQEMSTRHPDSIATPPPVNREQIKAQKALFHEVREQGRKRDWAKVLVATEELCASDETCPPILRSCYAEAALRLGKPERYVALMRNGDRFTELASLALLNQREEYLQKIEEILDPLDPSSASGMDANNAAWAAVLSPGPLPQPEKVVALAEHGVAHPERIGVMPGQPDNSPEFLNTLGIALYRVGRYTEAIERLHQSEARFSNTINWPFLALAYRRLGKEAEATRWAKRYREHIDETFARVERGRLEKLLFLNELNSEFPEK